MSMDTHRPINIPEPHPAVIFDLDDSLIFCGRHYEEARMGLYDFLADVTRSSEMPSREDFYKLHCQYDASRLHASAIPVKDRFPTSLSTFYELWCKEHGIRCDAATVQQVLKLGYNLLTMDFEAMPGACQLLEDLSRTHDLYLYTCGDQDIQLRRVLTVGFDHFFKAIGVPERKTVRPLVRFMIANGLNTRDTWVVGNSRKSDIEPALGACIPPEHTVLIDSYSWSAEEATITQPIHIVKDLTEVAPLIQRVEVLA